jgi:hypothetical protein
VQRPLAHLAADDVGERLAATTDVREDENTRSCEPGMSS